MYEILLAFSIDSHYDTLVGTTAASKQRFLTLMQSQLADLLLTDQFHLLGMNATRGSTIVTTNVVGYNQLDADQLSRATTDISNLFAQGSVQLVSRKVEKQNVNICTSDSVRTKIIFHFRSHLCSEF